jgi:hypothetical protein
MKFTFGQLRHIGCPLFGLTIEIAERGAETFWSNPTARFFASERNADGECHLWFGRRVHFIITPRHLQPRSPLFVIE